MKRIGKLLATSLEESKVSSARHDEELLRKEAEIERLAEEILNLEDTLQRCDVDISNMTMNYNIEEQKLADAKPGSTHCTRRAD